MKEEKIPKVEIIRHQSYEDGKILDDYLRITYRPDQNNKWDYDSITVATKNMKGFIEALNGKMAELETEAQHTKPLILGTNQDIDRFGGVGAFGSITQK